MFKGLFVSLIISIAVTASAFAVEYTSPEYEYGYSCKNDNCELYVYNTDSYQIVESLGNFVYHDTGNLVDVISNFNLKKLYILKSFTGGGAYKLSLFDVEQMKFIECDAKKLDLFPYGYKLTKDGKWLYYSTIIWEDKDSRKGTYMFDAANLKVNKVITDWAMTDLTRTANHSYMTGDGNRLLVKSTIHYDDGNYFYEIIDSSNGQIIGKIDMKNDKNNSHKYYILNDFKSDQMLITATTRNVKTGKPDRMEAYKYNLKNSTFSDAVSFENIGELSYIDETSEIVMNKLKYNATGDLITVELLIYDIDSQKPVKRFAISSNSYLKRITVENGKAVFDEGGNNFVTIQKDKATGEYKFERKFPPGLENKPTTPLPGLTNKPTPPGQEKKQ